VQPCVFGVDTKVLLAELKGSGTYFAIKALKKDVVLEDNDTECTMLERRVLELGSQCPYLTYLHSSFQSPVSVSISPSLTFPVLTSSFLSKYLSDLQLRKHFLPKHDGYISSVVCRSHCEHARRWLCFSNSK